MIRSSPVWRRAFSTEGESEISKLIESDISTYPVMLYMKGNPEAPQCGFSSKAVQILQAVGVEFASRDVLQDPELREGVKAFSEWPTIPQCYVAGEFVGGSDTLFEMFKSGELDTLLDEKKVERIAQEKD